MSESVTISLGDVLSNPPEYGANATASAPDGVSPRYLRITDIDEAGRLLHDDVKSIAASVARPYLLDQDDIVIARTGNTVGKAYLHDERNGPLAFAGYLIRFRIDPKKAAPGFVFQFLHSPRYYAWVQRTLRTGAQPNINAAEYKRLPVPAFTPAEQRRIAQILATVDEAIAHTEALIAKHQQMKAGLMLDLFSRGVTPDGNLRLTRTQAPHLYRHAALGWIPKEWKVKPLGTMSEIVSGVTLGSKLQISDRVNVPYLRVANVQDGYFDLAEMKTVDVSRAQFEKLQLRAGDVLMNEGGDFDKLGRGSVWQEEIKPCIHQNHVFRVRPRSDVMRSYYLAFWSQSEAGKNYFVLNSKQSTNLASINSTQLNRFPVALPSVEEQEQIETRIASSQARIDVEATHLAKLRLQKQGLMHDLLTARVQVKAPKFRESASSS